ncbi:MAG: hypothetical protein J6J23_06975, partial [Clostridia bacterium]|nr:hypothetical protein [Clostridia bacterium]
IVYYTDIEDESTENPTYLSNVIVARFERVTTELTIAEVVADANNGQRIIKDTDVVVDAFIASSNGMAIKYIDMIVTNSVGAEIKSGSVPMGESLTIKYTVSLPFTPRYLPGAVYATSGDAWIMPSEDIYTQVYKNGSGTVTTPSTSSDGVTNPTYTLSAPLIVEGETYISVLNNTDTFYAMPIYTTNTVVTKVVYPLVYVATTEGETLEAVQRAVTSNTSVLDNADTTVSIYLTPYKPTSTYYEFYGWTSCTGYLNFNQAGNTVRTHKYFDTLNLGSTLQASDTPILSGGATKSTTKIQGIYAIWAKMGLMLYKDDATYDIVPNIHPVSSLPTGWAMLITGKLYSSINGGSNLTNQTINVSSSTEFKKFNLIYTKDSLNNDVFYFDEDGVHLLATIGSYYYQGITPTLNSYTLNSSTQSQTVPLETEPTGLTTTLTLANNGRTFVYICATKHLSSYYISAQNSVSTSFKTYYFNALVTTAKKVWTGTGTYSSTITPIANGWWEFYGMSGQSGYGPSTTAPGVYSAGSTSYPLISTITECYATYKATTSLVIQNPSQVGATAMHVNGVSNIVAQWKQDHTVYWTPTYSSVNTTSTTHVVPETEYTWGDTYTQGDPILIGFSDSPSSYDPDLNDNGSLKYATGNYVSIDLWASGRAVYLNPKFRFALVQTGVKPSTTTNSSGSDVTTGAVSELYTDGNIVISNINQIEGDQTGVSIEGDYLTTLKVKFTASAKIEFQYGHTGPSNNYYAIRLKREALVNSDNFSLSFTTYTSNDNGATWSEYPLGIYGYKNASTTSTSYTGTATLGVSAQGVSQYVYLSAPNMNTSSTLYKVVVQATSIGGYGQGNLVFEKSAVQASTSSISPTNIQGLSYSEFKGGSNAGIMTVNEVKFSGQPMVFNNETKQFTFEPASTYMSYNMQITLPYNSLTNIMFDFRGSSLQSSTSAMNSYVAISDGSSTIKVTASNLTPSTIMTGGKTITFTFMSYSTSDKFVFRILWRSTFSSSGYNGNVFANTSLLGVGGRLDFGTFRTPTNDTIKFSSWQRATTSDGSITALIDASSATALTFNETFADINAIKAICYDTTTFKSKVYACYVDASDFEIEFVPWIEDYTEHYRDAFGNTTGTTSSNSTYSIQGTSFNIYNAGGTMASFPVPAMKTSHSSLKFVGWFRTPGIINSVDTLLGCQNQLVVAPASTFSTSGADCVIENIANYTTGTGWDVTTYIPKTLYARYIEVYEISMYDNDAMQTYADRTQSSTKADHTMYEYYGIGFYSQLPSYSKLSSANVEGISNYAITSVAIPTRNVAFTGYKDPGYNATVQRTLAGGATISYNGQYITNGTGTIATTINGIPANKYFRTDEVITAFWNATQKQVLFKHESNIPGATVIIQLQQSDNDDFSLNGYQDDYAGTSSIMGIGEINYTLPFDEFVYTGIGVNMWERIIATATLSGDSSVEFLGWYSRPSGGIRVLNPDGTFFENNGVISDVIDGETVYFASFVNYDGELKGQWHADCPDSIALYPHFGKNVEVLYGIEDPQVENVGSIYGNIENAEFNSDVTVSTNGLASQLITQKGLTPMDTPVQTQLQLYAKPQGSYYFVCWTVDYYIGGVAQERIFVYDQLWTTFEIQNNWESIVVLAWFDDNPPPQTLVRVEVKTNSTLEEKKYFGRLYDAINYANGIATSKTVDLYMLGNTTRAIEGMDVNGYQITGFTIKRPMSLQSDGTPRKFIGLTGASNGFTFNITNTNLTSGWSTTTANKHVLVTYLCVYGNFNVGSGTALVTSSSAGAVTLANYNANNKTITVQTSASALIEKTGSHNNLVYQYNTSYAVIENSGTLTISGASAFTSSTRAITNNSSGTFNLNGGTVGLNTNNNLTGGNNALIYNSGAFNANGGTVNAQQFIALHNTNSTANKCNLGYGSGAGTTFNSSNAKCISNTGHMTINGSTVNGTGTYTVYSSGTLLLNKGTITSNGGKYVVYLAGGANNYYGDSSTVSTLNITGTGLQNDGAGLYVATSATLKYINSTGTIVANQFGIHNRGTISTIKTAKVESTGYHAIYNHAGATLTSIQGGTFKQSTTGATSYKSVLFQDSSVLMTISGGTFTASGTGNTRVSVIMLGNATGDEKLKITGGNFYGGATYVVVNDGGILEIAGGTFSATTGGGTTLSQIASKAVLLNQSGGECSISNGVLRYGLVSAIINYATMEISGGTITGRSTSTSNSYNAIINGTDTTSAELTISGTSTTGITSNSTAQASTIINSKVSTL